jgi:hypothetical protein
VQLPVEGKLRGCLTLSAHRALPLTEPVPQEYAKSQDRQDGCHQKDHFNSHLPAPPQWTCLIALSYPIAAHSKHCSQINHDQSRFCDRLAQDIAGRALRVGQPVLQGEMQALLVIAAVAVAILGAVGAAANRVNTWDEFLLWVIGGAIGGVLAVSGWTGAILGGSALFGPGVTVVTAASLGLLIFVTAALLGAGLTPLLDSTERPPAWWLSFVLKWLQSPLLTTVGLAATLIVALRGRQVHFHRGMLFIEVSSGDGALTLGAVAWTQSGRFNPDATVPDGLARHEATHSRTVAAIGEFGFYVTYVTIGAIWGWAEGGSWNNLNASGFGNPFEKTAHTFTGDPAIARPTGVR